MLVVALRGLPVTLVGLDPIRLDPGTAFVQAFGVFAAGVPVQSSLRLPVPGGFAGLAVAWQGLVFDASFSLQVSNPTWFVLR